MSDQYPPNQQMPGSSYGFPQYPGGIYAANQMGNPLGYQTHQAVIGGTEMMQAMGFQPMPGLMPPPLHGVRRGLDPMDIQAAAAMRTGKASEGDRRGAKKKTPKKKPKKKVSTSDLWFACPTLV